MVLCGTKGESAIPHLGKPQQKAEVTEEHFLPGAGAFAVCLQSVSVNGSSSCPSPALLQLPDSTRAVLEHHAAASYCSDSV